MIHDETSTSIRRVINLSTETSTKQLNLYIYIYIYIYMTHNLHRKIKLTITRYLKGTNLHFASTNFCEWFFTKRFAGMNFRKSRGGFFADSLQLVVIVSMQDYCNTETFSATVRRFLDVKRLLLKKQYESTNKFFGMALFTWLNIVE